MAKQSTSAKKIESTQAIQGPVVLINRDDNRKHIPYGRDADAPMLGVADDKTPGISKLHMIHPGINPPLDREIYDEVRKNTMFRNLEERRRVYELSMHVSEMEDESCEGMLERSSSLDGLKWWLMNETRTAWKKRLRKHITEMEEVMRKKGQLRDEEED